MRHTGTPCVAHTRMARHGMTPCTVFPAHRSLRTAHPIPLSTTLVLVLVFPPRAVSQSISGGSYHGFCTQHVTSSLYVLLTLTMTTSNLALYLIIVLRRILAALSFVIINAQLAGSYGSRSWLQHSAFKLHSAVLCGRSTVGTGTAYLSASGVCVPHPWWRPRILGAAPTFTGTP